MYSINILLLSIFQVYWLFFLLSKRNQNDIDGVDGRDHRQSLDVRGSTVKNARPKFRECVSGVGSESRHRILTLTVAARPNARGEGRGEAEVGGRRDGGVDDDLARAKSSRKDGKKAQKI